MAIFHHLLLVCLLFPDITAVQWLSDPAGGDTVFVCEGQNATLPLDFSSEDGEELIAVRWLFGDSTPQELMAIFDRGIFNPLPAFSNRVQQAGLGGLVVSHVTPEDAGSYTIEVEGRNGLSIFRNVTLHVSDSLQTEDGRLHVTVQPEATLDPTTHQWSVELDCGRFVFPQQPPFVVEWITPTGTTVPSSTYTDGFFHLHLSRPLQEGTYLCRVPPSSTCLPADKSTSVGQASIKVERGEMRMMLREAELASLKQDKLQLQQHKDIVKQDKLQLKQHKDIVKQDKLQLQQHKDIVKQDKLRLKQHKDIVKQDKLQLKQHKDIVKQDKLQLKQHKDIVKEDKLRLKQHKDIVEQDKLQLKQHKDIVKQDKLQLKQHKDIVKQDKLQMKQHKDIVKQDKLRLKQHKDIVKQDKLQLQQHKGTVKRSLTQQLNKEVGNLAQQAIHQRDNPSLSRMIKDAEAPRVTFKAHSSQAQTLTPPAHTQFDVVLQNKGDGFNSASGDFTAPVSGVYLLSFHTVSVPRPSPHSLLKVQGKEVCTAYIDINDEQGWCQAAVHMNAGDTAWVEPWTNDVYYSPFDTTFVGFLWLERPQ